MESTTLPFSRIFTVSPDLVASIAHERPAGPAPTTIRSVGDCTDVVTEVSSVLAEFAFSPQNRGIGSSLCGMLVALIERNRNSSKKTMQTAFEFLGSAVFFLFLILQVGLVGMIVVARLLKAMGALKEDENHQGIRGFFQGFC